MLQNRKEREFKWQVEELIRYVCARRMEKDTPIYLRGEVGPMLKKNYGVSLIQYMEIIKDLLPFIDTHTFIEPNTKNIIVRSKK